MNTSDDDAEMDSDRERTDQSRSVFTARSLIIMFGVYVMFMVARTPTELFLAACFTTAGYCIDRFILHKKQ